MSDLKRGQKTLTGEDELEVDKINIVGEGIGCNDDYGTNGEILQKSLATNELVWTTFVIPDDSITETMLQDNIISENKLKDDCVTTQKIGTHQVLTDNLGGGQVTTDKIALGAIIQNRIADFSIVADKLASSAVSTDKIQANAVTGPKIAIQSIDSTHIVANSIIAGNIANTTITGDKIAANTVSGTRLLDNSIASSKIGDREIQGGKIALNTIDDDNIIGGVITGSKLALGTITSDRLGPDCVTQDKIADGAIVSANLTAGLSVDSFGSFTLRNPSNSQQITFACNNSHAAIGSRTSGLGSTTIGPTQQIGFIIDDPVPAGHGTDKKGLIYSNAVEAVIPANSGTGWLPLQVKTAGGNAGDRFSVDLSGNLFTALKVSCNNLEINSGVSTISNTGNLNCNNINANSIDLGNSDIDASGNITGVSLDLGNAGIDNLGNLSCENITMTANNRYIQFGSVENSFIIGSSHTSKTQQTNMFFASTSNLWRNLNFESEQTQTYIIGSTYPSLPTIATYLDLRSTTNLFPDALYPLPYRCYEESGQVYLAINSGDWRPNDDSTYFNLNIVDSNATYRGRAQVDSSSLEACAMILVPDGWEATHIKLYGTGSRVIELYQVYNTNSGGSSSFLSSGTKYTNNEYQLSYSDGTARTFTGRKDFSLLAIVKPSSTSDYISGGYLKIQRIVSGGQ